MKETLEQRTMNFGETITEHIENVTFVLAYIPIVIIASIVSGLLNGYYSGRRPLDWLS